MYMTSPIDKLDHIIDYVDIIARPQWSDHRLIVANGIEYKSNMAWPNEHLFLRDTIFS